MAVVLWVGELQAASRKPQAASRGSGRGAVELARCRVRCGDTDGTDGTDKTDDGPTWFSFGPPERRPDRRHCVTISLVSERSQVPPTPHPSTRVMKVWCALTSASTQSKSCRRGCR